MNATTGSWGPRRPPPLPSTSECRSRASRPPFAAAASQPRSPNSRPFPTASWSPCPSPSARAPLRLRPRAVRRRRAEGLNRHGKGTDNEGLPEHRGTGERRQARLCGRDRQDVDTVMNATTGGSDLPGLDLARLDKWFSSSVPGAGGDLSARHVSGGRSNLTYEVSDGAATWIVRRSPLGHVLATAHDMAREYRVMSALRATDVPVPTTYELCQDEDVLGAPFYVMERVAGTPYRHAAELEHLGPRTATATCPTSGSTSGSRRSSWPRSSRACTTANCTARPWARASSTSARPSTPCSTPGSPP